MAFRIKTAIVTLLTETLVYAAPVVHQHLRHGGPGDLAVTEEGISFTETGKHANHSRTWKYDEIQQLELTDSTLRVLTYEDQKWELGRDREYQFDRLPKDFARSAYPIWKDKLDQRFVAAIADPDVATLAEFPAKLKGVTHGVEGTLRFGEDRIVFRAARSGESRTWRFTDIDNIASAGRFDLSVVTLEKEFRFQLQRPMEEARFNDLWRRVEKLH